MLQNFTMDKRDVSFQLATEEQSIPFIDGMAESNESTEACVIDNPIVNNNRNTNGDEHQTGTLSLFGKCSFPWLLSVSMVQLGIYLNKLYQDSAAVAVYYDARDINYCIVSAACLFIPTIIYIVYQVSFHVKQEEETDNKEVGTRIVHGLLLVPWQIKGRVELLHFSAQRVCQRRKLTSDEVLEKCALERQAGVLEFFEEFYAGFLQLLLQLYIIIISLDKNVHSKALPGEIVASALTLMAMMAAVRRKDDGILTSILSIIGWISMIVSRSVAIALATTVIHSFMLLLCVLHAALVSLWISFIAIQSCQQSTPLTFKRKVGLFFFVLTVFGLPSLTYWPVMFQLKDRKRPYIFLFLMFVENCFFVAIWYLLKTNEVMLKHHVAVISVIVGGFVVGVLFIYFYISCKPKYTDQVVYHDMKIQNSESFGMYFEFCDLAFQLPRTQSLELKLNKVRKAEQAFS